MSSTVYMTDKMLTAIHEKAIKQSNLNVPQVFFQERKIIRRHPSSRITKFSTIICFMPNNLMGNNITQQGHYMV